MYACEDFVCAEVKGGQQVSLLFITLHFESGSPGELRAHRLVEFHGH